jgi:predicted membrane-bound spermidine synthase
MIATDGRNFLKLTRETYDVITIDPPPPIDAAGVNSLYTRELMQLARSRLKKGGIFAHWIPFPGMSGVDQEAYDLLVVTFADVFPYVYMKTGYNNFGMHIIGSLEPLNLAGADLKSRKNIDKIAKDILEWDPVPSSYFQRIDLYNKVPANIRLLTDDNPQLEFYLVRTVLQRGTKELINNYW